MGQERRAPQLGDGAVDAAQLQVADPGYQAGCGKFGLVFVGRRCPDAADCLGQCGAGL